MQLQIYVPIPLFATAYLTLLSRVSYHVLYHKTFTSYLLTGLWVQLTPCFPKFLSHIHLWVIHLLTKRMTFITWLPKISISNFPSTNEMLWVAFELTLIPTGSSTHFLPNTIGYIKGCYVLDCYLKCNLINVGSLSGNNLISH